MTSLRKKQKDLDTLHDQVLDVLKKYKCEYELHEVRALFMGAIASPVEQVNPMDEVKSLWDGQLPPVDRVEDINEIMSVLAMGLWNQLSTHIALESPFVLMAYDNIETFTDLKEMAQVKVDEIHYFISGYMQGEDKITLLPEIAESLETLDDLSLMFNKMIDTAKKAQATEQEFIELVDELMQNCEITIEEMNFIIVSTAETRGQGGTLSRSLH
jgi:uncharacterized protein YecA (UPF0149 family)